MGGVESWRFHSYTRGTKHAWRNVSDESNEGLITTTSKLGRFFQEVGRPVIPGKHLPPPTPDELKHFMQIASKYNHWLGDPEENAAMGISAFG